MKFEAEERFIYHHDMGAFYGSIQVRTTDRSAVKAIAEQVCADKKIRCLLGPELFGWVGIYPEGDAQDSVAAEIAKQIDADLLHLMVHDDDVLAYWLYRRHELVDSYWSSPGYFGEENQADEESRRGNPEQFRPIIGDKSDRLLAILDRDAEYTFESERLLKLTKVLGISNSVTSYDLLTSDERAGIKSWRKFDSIPPNKADQITSEAKPKPPSRKLIRQKLQKSGLLLYSHEWKEFTQLLQGFTLADGFVLGWVNPWHNTAELFQLAPPGYLPELLPFDPDQFAAKTQGNFAVAESADVLRILDKSCSPWKLIGEMPKHDRFDFGAISPNGEYMALRNAQRIAVRKIPSGDLVFEVPFSRSTRVAFHPTENWLAVSGDMLGLICFDSTPQVKNIYVGGNSKSFVIGNVRGFEEPGCVGFSRDGRFLWCGTNVGMQIYEWDSLRTNASHNSRWRIRLHDKLPSFWTKQITAIAEEGDCTGIVFGTFAGKLGRFDLQTGEMHKLVELPICGEVENLMFSADWKTLAVSTVLTTQKGRRSMPEYTRAWELFDYGKLRESGELRGTAQKPQPVVSSDASLKDLSQWRRVSAKGFKR